MQDVHVLGGLGQGRERRGQLHDALCGGIQQRDATGLDDAGLLDAAVATHRHADHQRAGQALAARFVGVIEIADALGAVDPRPQVVGVDVFLGAGRDELALRTLGVQLRTQVVLGGQSRHLGIALHLLLALRQLGLIRLRTGLCHRSARIALACGDHPAFRRRRRGRRLRAQGLRGQSGIGLGNPAGLAVAWTLGLVAFTAAFLVGGGQEVGFLRRQRRAGLAQDHVQRGHHRRGIVQGEAHAQHQQAVHDQRQRQGGAEAFVRTDLRWGDGDRRHLRRASSRSRRTAGRRCSARTAHRVRARRWGW